MRILPKLFSVHVIWLVHMADDSHQNCGNRRLFCNIMQNYWDLFGCTVFWSKYIIYRERRGEKDRAENGWMTSRNGAEKKSTHSRHMENGGEDGIEHLRALSLWSNGCIDIIYHVIM